MSRIRRIYLNDASGVIDEELVDDVGWALHARCESILMVTSASQVDCPSCDARITAAGERWSKEDGLRCANCGWAATYGQWRDSWRHRDLTGGNAIYAFEEFAKSYPQLRTTTERMLAIDRLINAFHWSLRRDEPSGPAAANILGGSKDEVLAFLDELAATDGPDQAESGRRRRAWAEGRRAGTGDGAP